MTPQHDQIYPNFFCQGVTTIVLFNEAKKQILSKNDAMGII